MAASLVGSEASLPGFIPVEIKPGTNVVERLPFTTKLLPRLEKSELWQPGDTVCWSNRTATYDGEEWNGKDVKDAALPVHEKVIIIRTVATNTTWNIGGFIDINKMK